MDACVPVSIDIALALTGVLGGAGREKGDDLFSDANKQVCNKVKDKCIRVLCLDETVPYPCPNEFVFPVFPASDPLVCSNSDSCLQHNADLKTGQVLYVSKQFNPFSAGLVEGRVRRRLLGIECSVVIVREGGKVVLSTDPTIPTQDA